MGAEVIVCSTCKFAPDERDGPDGVRGGQRLYESIHAVAQQPRFAALTISSVECLWACAHHCTVHIRSPGKCAYVAGRFDAAGAEAEAILEFALAYAASADGAVPYRDWPAGVKGHFLVRTPAP